MVNHHPHFDKILKIGWIFFKHFEDFPKIKYKRDKYKSAPCTRIAHHTVQTYFSTNTTITTSIADRIDHTLHFLEDLSIHPVDAEKGNPNLQKIISQTHTNGYTHERPSTRAR